MKSVHFRSYLVLKLALYMALFFGMLFQTSCSSSYETVFPENAPTPIDLQTASQEIETLSEQTYRLFHQENWRDALLSAERLENLLNQSGNAILQPDLLYNQSLAYYRLGQYAEAMANLRQLAIIESSEQTTKMIDQLQHLIEMRAYEKSPNATFIQGYSDKYLLWEWSHSFSHQMLHLVLFLTTLCACIAFIANFLLKNYKSIRILIQIFIVYLVVFYSVIFFVEILHVKTESYTFAILLSPKDMHTEPDYHAPAAFQDELLEGATLQIISRNDTWALVKRSDGVVFWIPEDHLYPLRSL